MTEFLPDFEPAGKALDSNLQEFEDEFTVDGIAEVSGIEQTFGEQVMQAYDLESLSTSMAGPTWVKTGMKQDLNDWEADVAG